ncbi:MAG: choice-of-anchor J domain-containing protein, partial [Muribaculaceae bacterium]|nr:choice-of-anchor J domain-containing protein [Muribaculaceae bacterium]
PQSGVYNICVTPLGRHGRGPSQFIEQWIGPDATLAPSDVLLKYSQEDKRFELTWKAPTKSVNGGYIDWSKVTYDIFDINAQLVKSGLDTCYMEIPDPNPDPNGKWRYSVVANHMGEKSLSGVSNLVGMNSAPYHEDFTNGDNFHDWTVEDVDNDQVTWKWPYQYTTTAQHQAWIHGARNKVINDWLFTPALRLEAGKEYDLYLEIEGQQYCSDQLGVFIGSDVKSSTMTECLMQYTYVENTIGKKNMIFKMNFRVPETKVYYIGLHAKGYQEYSGGFSLEDFRLESGLDLNAPGMGTFTVAPDPSPSVKLEATISYIAPDTTILGAKIDALTKVEFYRDEQLVKTFENPAPGATLTYLDTNITLGDHQWRVKPYSAVGEGKNILADAYVGIRQATEVKNIKITEMGNSGVVTVSWEAPKVDVEGNELDPNQVYYHVYKPGGLFLESVAYTNPGETSMMLNTRISTQAFMTYYIAPVTAAGENKNARIGAEYTPLGTPYSLPFVESAPSIRVQHNWAMGGNTNEKWQVSAASGTPKCDPQDNDGGMWVWVPVGDGAWSRLTSGKVYVSGANPIATFFYRAMSDCTDTMEFQVREIGQDNWVTLKTIVFNEIGKDDWVKGIVPVADYVGKNVQFGWYDECNSKPQVHCLDNINIAEAVANEAKINSVVIPSKVDVNDQLNVAVAIENLGTEAIKEVNVALTRDGEIVATAEPFALGFGERKQITLIDNDITMFLPNKLSYRVEVTLVNENGESTGVLSDKYEVELLKPFQPVVDDLAATKTNAGTQLTWSTPKNATENPDHYFTDDVEPYPSYVPDQAGKWTFVDVDKSSTAGINGISFPYLHTPFAWIVNDATHPGFNETWEAHSGNKYFMSMSANNGKPTDDWMISPLLSGVEQNLSFWAKSYNNYYGDEEFEILYSTTGKNIADFTKIGYDTVPMAWTKFEFTIPEGAKYFAIRNMGYDHWILQIDDITYNQGGGKLELLGYNVYRNGEKINDKLVTETSFIDEESSSTRDVWYVTAVYDLGESDISNAAKIGTTSLDDVIGEGVSVTVEDTDIIITGAEGSDIAVYATSGITVYAGTGEPVTRVSISTAGVYLVQINGKAVKVTVK